MRKVSSEEAHPRKALAMLEVPSGMLRTRCGGTPLRGATWHVLNGLIGPRGDSMRCVERVSASRSGRGEAGTRLTPWRIPSRRGCTEGQLSLSYRVYPSPSASPSTYATKRKAGGREATHIIVVIAVHLDGAACGSTHANAGRSRHRASRASGPRARNPLA